eukprot:jgi/Ulvmu1/3519/UM162_0026.1
MVIDDFTAYSVSTTTHPDTPAHAAWHALAALAPANAAAYAELARLPFVLKSCVMILLSAFVAARSAAVLWQPTVWAAAAITACITSGSMMVNDYFDWKSGVDAVNASSSSRPIP